MRRLIRSFGLSGLLIVLCLGGLARVAPGEVEVEHLPKKGKIRVELDGELYTEYIYEGQRVPVNYPVVGPHGIVMVRHFPFKKDVEGESSDHDHHRSLWYAHGKVNGHDFWHDETIEHVKVLEAEGDTIRTRNRWVASDGSVVCTDTRTLRFGKVPGGRYIDYKVTLHASEGPVKLGDTKEGTMAIRTRPELRIDKDAHAVNSEGVTGKPVWGKSAKWVDYSAKVRGKTVGVGIFDHPSNPHHPSTWHARHYGLIAANPFGYSYFKGSGHDGSIKVKEGEDITFRYRFLFHKGDAESAQIAQRYAQWAAGG